MIFLFSIGNLTIKMVTDYNIILPVQYLPFVRSIEDSNDNVFLTIYIKDGFNDFPLLNTLFDGSTHKWYGNYKEEFCMIFSSRNKFIKDSSPDELWYIKCDRKNYNCFLCIPNWSNRADYVNKEIFDRPWLQRVVAAYLNPENTNIIHGGAFMLGESGVLILGECGSGKSTLCDIAESQGNFVVADDRIMLHSENPNSICFGTPWNMKNAHYNKNYSLDISIILFIGHGEKNSLVRLDNDSGAINMFCSQLYLSLPKPPEIAYAMAYRYSRQFIKNKKVFQYNFVPDRKAVLYLSNKLGELEGNE